jgi:hypothetical protein
VTLPDALFHYDMDGNRIPHDVNPGPGITCKQCTMLRCGADFVWDGQALEVCVYCTSKNDADEWFHTRVRGILLNHVAKRREHAEKMWQAAANATKEAQRIEEAACRGEWGLLRGILSEYEIERLCSVSPTNLLKGDDE